VRSADAVHLASAIALADPDLIIAVWDRRLHASAAAAGLQVTLADIHEPDLQPPPEQSTAST
jgi:uncharacterized protein